MAKLLTDRGKLMAVPSMVIALGVMLVIVLTGCSAGGATRAPVRSTAASGGTGKVVIVDISMFSFRPSTVTVTPGTKVAWSNKDSTEHTATADDGTTFDTGAIQQGQTKTFTFTKPGRYAYHCAFHPFMTGTVVVK